MLLFKTLLLVLEWCGWIVLGLFSLHQLWLVALCLRARGRVPRPIGRLTPLPAVTVQLPLFNERYVVDRLLDAVMRLDYPRDRLEIQVLDDSTDETTALVAERVAELSARGIRIVHRHRSRRAGFKAGALAAGLAEARGELIAIFDADFVPPPDFLRRTIHYFADPAVGMLQTRWGYVNRRESWLTRAQALMLDGHFLIEQVARADAGLFFNFNGSAGLWRRQAILDAGGWRADTLTEDLDLSYRAQLRGWRFVYVKDIVVPGELPTRMASLKAQHHRWTKGSIQTAMKLLAAVLHSRQPGRVKLAACFHFGNWLTYPIGLLVSVLILPHLLLSPLSHPLASSRGLAVSGSSLGLLLIGTTCLFHLVAQRQARALSWAMLAEVPVLMAVTVGLALNNTHAIWEALRGVPSAFERTPKCNGRADAAIHRQYRTELRGRRQWVELALGAYTSIAIGYAASCAFYAVVPFLLPVSAGFWYAALSSLTSLTSLAPVASPHPVVASTQRPAISLQSRT